MTFYNHIENARYRCIERFNCQGQRGASDKAYVGESLDQARCEYDRLQAERDQLKAENAKLRKYAKLMHDHINECCNACGERCICDIDALTRELGIEVSDV